MIALAFRFKHSLERLSASGFALACLVCCTSGDVAVFEAHSTDVAMGGSGGSLSSSSSTGMPDAGMDADAGTPCKEWLDCAPGEYCSKQACSSTQGTCQPIQTFCDATPDPVCGCDGVNYWNDCVRQQFGVMASTPGQCSGGRKCVYNGDCRLYGVVCSRLLYNGQPCPMPGQYVEGQCWGMPPLSVCDRYDDPQRWQLCTPPDAPPPECQETCFSIISQLPHRMILDQAMCP